MTERYVRASRDLWLRLSHAIHAQPELAFQEVESSALVAETLVAQGFDVRKPAYELETALSARAGSGTLHVALCAEYDALPEIGHACGHNIIAAASVAAACALREVANDLDLTVEVLGTPAEEDGAGKVILLERGAFDEPHLVLMAHPSPFDDPAPPLIAATHFTFEFIGKGSHAAAAADLALNAADAANLAQVGIALLRQQLPEGVRIHGIVTEAGSAPNIIPALSRGKYAVRAPAKAVLDQVLDRVEACFRGAAVSTGCEVVLRRNPRPLPEVRHDTEIASIYQRNAEHLGRRFCNLEHASRFTASTDFGAISQLVPSIHPHISICSPDVANHQPAFTAASRSRRGDDAVVDAAIGLAWTVIDVAQNTDIRSRLEERKHSAPNSAPGDGRHRHAPEMP
ncbi:M20 family metallopeptidase [Amycolatopsis rubida]|uniref:Peptidase M20 domain-containing protein 2 n=1 Tax=Amycolatopsis rubida TaxID=112413 RepID=A0ABX0CDD7_9PSEU|nr:amidohydrolase [Amycolatopsis rubida]NEC62983.1 M20 family metallopeptidase [Amycolatopsis rubida]